MGLLLLLELVGVVEVMLVGVCLGSAFGASGRCSVAMLPQRLLASSCRVGVGGGCVVDSRAPTAAVVRHSNARARRGVGDGDATCVGREAARRVRRWRWSSLTACCCWLAGAGERMRRQETWISTSPVHQSRGRKLSGSWVVGLGRTC